MTPPAQAPLPEQFDKLPVDEWCESFEVEQVLSRATVAAFGGVCEAVMGERFRQECELDRPGPVGETLPVEEPDALKNKRGQAHR